MTLPAQPHVGLFVTCLVNLFRPSVGFASIELLEQAGCTVEIPEAQTCCGQPGYNPGDFASTRAVAKQVINIFSGFDYVVVPSGSCAGMLRVHYPALFKTDTEWLQRAQTLANKTFELTSFLADVLHFQPSLLTDLSDRRVTYHDACAGLRELGIKHQPRLLLKQCANISITEMEKTEECCGFGGTFCAKMPTISEVMVNDKLNAATATGADTILAGDMGCLLNIAGRARRLNQTIEVRHVAEVLANKLDQPGIGKGELS
jgi:L-lactate dehydrogenase complex protein LldE